MAKKKIPELFGQGTQSEHVANAGKSLADHIMNTEKTRGAHRANTKSTRFEKYKKTELKTFSIRLHPKDIVTLTKYFTRRGLAVSQGIRQIVLDFIEREGLE